MILFLYDTTEGGTPYAKGSIAQLSPEVKVALIQQGNAKDFPVISRSVEILSSSAIATPCISAAVDEVLTSFTIPPRILGVNSILQIEPMWTFTSSANNKILKVKIGGVTVYQAARTTSVKEAPLVVLANRNSVALQIKPYDNSYAFAGLDMPEAYSIDFSVAVNVQIMGQRTNSGDSLRLEYYRVLHFLGV